jgi:steroid 5-alpha reductase family enzyme
MKKLLFVGLAIGLPMAVATLASPPGVLVAGWPALTALALAAFSIQWLAFVPARIFETERFYDFIGSLTYIALTLAALGVAESLSPEQALIAAMVVIWAGRLGSFLFRRIHAVGGDQRFDHIKISSARFFVDWTLQ